MSCEAAKTWWFEAEAEVARFLILLTQHPIGSAREPLRAYETRRVSKVGTAGASSSAR